MKYKPVSPYIFSRNSVDESWTVRQDLKHILKNKLITGLILDCLIKIIQHGPEKRRTGTQSKAIYKPVRSSCRAWILELL